MTPRKTNEVLAAARKDVQAQLAVVREELGRLAGEERALTEALSSLASHSASSSSAAPAAGRSATAKRATRGKSRRKSAGRGQRSRGAVKSTAERVKELEELLSDGPKTRNDLAAALKVSPARVQQLLAELGSAVSSQPAPGQRQGKLWSLKRASGGGAATPRSGSAKATGAGARKPSARSRPAAAK